jgi:hypothetical protein
MSIEDQIQKIVNECVSSRHAVNLVEASDFCQKKNISRVTLWRAEKRGEVKLTRIGRRVFINLDQFAAV